MDTLPADKGAAFMLMNPGLIPENPSVEPISPSAVKAIERPERFVIVVPSVLLKILPLEASMLMLFAAVTDSTIMSPEFPPFRIKNNIMSRIN